MVIEFKVESIYKRADTYLTSKLQLSRNKIQDYIKSGKILLNNNFFKPSTSLKKGDRITAYIEEESESLNLKPYNYKLKILYEDDDIIVIDKQKGLVVHPARGHTDDTLVNALINHCSDLVGIGSKLRPGIVHRLDKDTSGVMVVAKNENSYYELQKQFKERLVEKKYLALIYGLPKKTEDIIITGIGRSSKDRKKFSVSSKGKEAITHYRVLKTNYQISLVDITIKTGRTHQIRVHMNYIGHPIIGDKTYGKKNYGGYIKDKNLFQLIDKIEGQALIAYSLRFTHPTTGKELFFNAHIPLDIQNLIDYLDKDANYF